MPTPRRRSTPMPTQAGKDTTKSKVVIPDGTPVEIVEQQGNKTMVYTAEVKEDESQNNQTNGARIFDEDEDDILHHPEPPAPTIPQSPLDNLFNDIVYCIESEGAYDNFIAKLLREPDNASDRFNIPCRDFIDVGAFSFSSIDRFKFYEAIQEANDNSGGRFAVSIYTHDYKTLYTVRNPASASGTQWHHRRELETPRQVVAKLVVMNPKPKPFIETNNTNTDTGIGAAILKLAEMQQQNHNHLMQVINRPPEKSEIEVMLMTAMVQKFSNDMINPPTAKANGIEETMSGVMQSVIVTQAMAEGFAKIINREPPAEREPTLIEQAKEILSIPAVSDAGDRIMGIIESAAVKGLKLEETAPGEATAAAPNQPAQPNPQAPPPVTMNQDQMELLGTIVEELDGENPLDATNETIKELRDDYPDDFADLTAMCQAAEFDGVFRMLLQRAAKIQPFPFSTFLDVAATQANMDAGNMTYPMPYVWNEQGLRLIERLKELHGYLKTV